MSGVLYVPVYWPEPLDEDEVPEPVAEGEPSRVRLEGSQVLVEGVGHVRVQQFLRDYAPSNVDGAILATPVTHGPMPLFESLDRALNASQEAHVEFLKGIIEAHEQSVEAGDEPVLATPDYNAVQVWMADQNNAFAKVAAPEDEVEGRLDPGVVRDILTRMTYGEPDEYEIDLAPRALMVSSMGEAMGENDPGYRMLKSLLGRYCPLGVEAISGVSTAADADPEVSSIAALHNSVVNDPDGEQLPFEPLGRYNALVHQVERDGVVLLAVEDFASKTVYAWSAAPQPENEADPDETDDHVPTF